MRWKCNNGREIEIADLSDQHLTNIGRMLHRNNFVTRDQFLECAAYCADPMTPDGARDAAEQECARMNFTPDTDAIFKEIDNRMLREEVFGE